MVPPSTQDMTEDISAYEIPVDGARNKKASEIPGGPSECIVCCFPLIWGAAGSLARDREIDTGREKRG